MNVSMLWVPNDRVQLPAAVAQRLELVVRLEALRRQARGRALEHATELDRVVDVGARELAHHEAAARERLEKPFVLERHEGDPERRPRDAELLDQTELGNALARLESPIEQELAEPERRLRRLRVRVVTAWHRNPTRATAAGRGCRASQRHQPVRESDNGLHDTPPEERGRSR